MRFLQLYFISSQKVLTCDQHHIPRVVHVIIFIFFQIFFRYNQTTLNSLHISTFPNCFLTCWWCSFNYCATRNLITRVYFHFWRIFLNILFFSTIYHYNIISKFLFLALFSIYLSWRLSLHTVLLQISFHDILFVIV